MTPSTAPVKQPTLASWVWSVFTVAAESPLDVEVDVDVVDELEDDGLLEHAAATTGMAAMLIAIANHLRRRTPPRLLDPSWDASSPRA
jgi:hypothetical protein